MNWIKQFVSRRRLYNDLSEEMQQHLEEKVEEFVAGGMRRADAVAAARRGFGNVSLLEERSREVWQWPSIETLFSDLRYAVRQLRKSPAFTMTAVVTLALGIGANTAVFSVVNAVILRPLPYADPDRLVSFQALNTEHVPHPDTLSYPNFFDFRAQNRVFERMVCYRGDIVTLTGPGSPQHLRARMVSWDLFPLLGIQPVLGRGFLPEEEKAGANVVILSYDLWQRRFGGDRTIAGRSITLDRLPYTVVGVAPAGFSFPAETRAVELWTSISRDAFATEGHPLTVNRGASVLRAIARLKPGVTVEQARAQMDAIAAALARQYPDTNTHFAGSYIQPELDRVVGDKRHPLLILMGAVGLVLLIACANMANLMLARTSEREREFAVRAAIGASRMRVVRQLLTESMLIASLGGLAGVLLANASLRFLLPFAADSIPRIGQVAVDVPVLGFSLVLAVVTTLLFSLAPAWQVAKVELTSSLKEGARSIARGHERLRGALVVGQITLGLTLLSAAGLLVASFLYLERQDLGFRPGHLLTFSVSLPEPQYSEAKEVQFFSLLVERLNALPGVQSAAVGGPLPMMGRNFTVSFNIEERPTPQKHRPSSALAIVSPGYFSTMGMPLLKGRDLTARDDASAPPVLLVNQAFAKEYFPGEEVIGKRFEPGASTSTGSSSMHEIVGVVGDAAQSPMEQRREPIYYMPHKQLPWDVVGIVVRTSVAPLSLESAIRAEVAAMDKQVPVYEVRTMDDWVSTAIATPRFQTLLLSSFAGIALLLTVVGLYGVMVYSVSKRTREFGVRIALGASRPTILAMVLKQAVALVGAGLVMGVAGALVGGQLLRNMLYGVTPRDPALLAIACLAITVTGILAAYLPARRAASTDPMNALRSE